MNFKNPVKTRTHDFKKKFKIYDSLSFLKIL